tara:strand:+ start:112 stop:348 length:237 start_codon:yes stop_codon:yes gene_type:complete
MNNKKTEPSGPSQEEEVVEEQELYLGDFLVRTEFFTKECYDRLILMEAKIGVMTEVMMSLRDVIYASMDLDNTVDNPN